MEAPGNRNESGTHSLFVDDLKQYQVSHKIQNDVNEISYKQVMILELATGYQNVLRLYSNMERLLKEKGLQVLNERINTKDPDENDIYKFLGVEQADGIKTKDVFERLSWLASTELNNVNLTSAVNAKVIPVRLHTRNAAEMQKTILMDSETLIRKRLSGLVQIG